MGRPKVVILGAGPAGVGGAFQLRRLDRAEVTVVEQRDSVGGNAGSFELDGHRVDYGSHRLHPACDPEILDDIRSLLGEDLVRRPRHGRIRLRGRWIHFPLKPADLLLRLDRSFAVSTFRDMVLGPLRGNGRSEGAETFASVLEEGLGPTICRDFYFPYARKIWGRDPEELSPIQARRRVSAGSFGRLLKKVAAQIPGLGSEDTGGFYYPRHGYGQISEAYAAAARERGAQFLLGWRVVGVRRAGEDGAWEVVAERAGERRALRADHVWSTIPVNLLARLADPPPPPEVLEAAEGITFRAMLLVYLDLPVDRFTEFDAHYLPGPQVSMSRLSEPKNYADRDHPRGRTVLCAELPCGTEDEVWGLDDAALGRRVVGDLERVGLRCPEPLTVEVRRLGRAYPIYLRGYTVGSAAFPGF